MAQFLRSQKRNAKRITKKSNVAVSASPDCSSRRNDVGRRCYLTRSATAAAVVAIASTRTPILSLVGGAAAIVTPNGKIVQHKGSRKSTYLRCVENNPSEPRQRQTNPKRQTTTKILSSSSSSSSSRTKKQTPVTTSFQPVWSGRYDNIPQNTVVVPVHTLILGTHPSIASFREDQYFGHPQNAFWWIAGDCLGFRRGPCVSPSTGQPYAIAAHLRYGDDKILSYDEQQQELVRHGFALWDIVGQCRRPGSLDQDIFDERPNDLRGFAQQHRQTLKRIVFANGGTGCTFFIKHFRDWLGSGELQAVPGHEPSEKMFSKVIAKEEANRSTTIEDTDHVASSKIDLFCALSVSPAAARHSYTEKRDCWEEYVYQPGLNDLMTMTQK
ncbi:T/U mismatch-specific DNA glycosylase [Nitzschia inconspicua]|uniref:T/U mismatch-specific DNA glycosylase n=1 Tax=Nitzschia inconspicua TaxID=303405 RepID=A0A9K3LJ92_9STRA|nr:T/U mismatch-specific DNA glycosylase [Nitzschia inconspicua]